MQIPWNLPVKLSILKASVSVVPLIEQELRVTFSIGPAAVLEVILNHIRSVGGQALTSVEVCN